MKKENQRQTEKGGVKCNFTEADVEREAEQTWIEGLLEEPDASEVKCQAALDELEDEEACLDLTRKFARESAKKTGTSIGEVLDHYETIVIELIRKRSGGALIHDDAADPLTLEKLEQLLYAATKTPAGYEVWPELPRMPERKALLRVLAPEYARDCNTLMRFLRAVFKRHRKIGGERSAWREKLCTHQLASEYGPKQIAIELEKRDVVANTKTEKEFEDLRARVRQTLQTQKKGHARNTA